AQQHRERAPEEERPALVPAEVVGRAEDDLPLGLLEPAAVEADEREIFGELGGIDEADGAPGRCVGEAGGEELDGGDEPGAEVRVRVDAPRAGGGGDGAQ